MMVLMQSVGLVLFCLAMLDRKSWPMLCVIGAVWWMTNWSGGLHDVMLASAYKVGFDLVAAGLAIRLAQSKVDHLVAGVFGLMLLNHSLFWIADAIHVDLWLLTTRVGNWLWLAQLGINATPGGLVAYGLLSRAWDRLADRRGPFERVATRLVSPRKAVR